MIALIVGVISATVVVPLLTEIDPTVLAGVLVNDVLDDSELRRAAENGDHAAQFKLGVALFEDPVRTGETSTQAIHWLKAASEGGALDAMIYLGRVLRSGVGILQDFAQASRWFHTAATRGSPEGMLETGRLYRDGVGVEKDPVKAYVWFNRAAAARNIEAVREREAIVSMLTPDDLKEAQRQSSLPGKKGGGNPPQNARD
jgi:TPR repeat protein